MKRLTKIFIVAMICGLFWGITAQAVEKTHTYTKNVDLDGNGKKEKIKIVCYVHWPDAAESAKVLSAKVYINNKRILNFRNTDIFNFDWESPKKSQFIVDFSKKDKKKELLLITQKESGGPVYTTLYRYKSGKLKKYVYGKGGDGEYKKRKLTDKGYVPCSYCEFRGNDKLTVPFVQVANRGRIQWFDLQYKVSGGKFVIDQSICHKPTGYFENETKVPEKTYVYAYPRINTNRQVFVLKKGEVCKVKNLKVTKKYTYLQVQKGKRKGWVVLRTEELRGDQGM